MTRSGFDTWTITDGTPVDLNGTLYGVRHQTYANGHVNTTLHGPKGGVYHLVARLSRRHGDTGLRDVVSTKGHPMTRHGNPVRVIVLGDQIEQVSR